MQLLRGTASKRTSSPPAWWSAHAVPRVRRRGGCGFQDIETHHAAPLPCEKPEYNTAPNIYYLEGSRQLLDPTEAGQSGIYKQGEMDMEREDVVPEWENKPGESRTVYDTFHEVPWETKIITYLLTKGASTGLLVISLFLWMFGFKSSLFSFWMPALSGILLAATGFVLITDLKRPERFYYIMLRSNWGSWMAWGTWFIALDGVFTLLWVLGALFGAEGFMNLILWPTIVMGLLASIYTGFFFAQASARDLWKGSENTLDIGVQSGLKGAAILLLFATLFPIANQASALNVLGGLLAVLVLLHLSILVFSILVHRFGSVAHERAIHLLTKGPFKNDFWGGAVIVDAYCPCFFSGRVVSAASARCWPGSWPWAGAYLWDKIWVKAGQPFPFRNTGVSRNMSTSHLQVGKGGARRLLFRPPRPAGQGPARGPAGQLNYTNTNGALTSYPSPDQWDNWTEYESTKWPQKVARNYALVPTLCFNCEAGCDSWPTSTRTT